MLQLYFAFILACLSVVSIAPASRAQAEVPSTPVTAFSRGLTGDIADLDHLLAQVNPGQTTLFLGDMGLRVAALQDYRQALAARQTGILRPNSSFNPLFIKWPGGNIPYTFTGVSAANQTTVLKACHDWQQVANIHFFPRTSETNYVVFTNSKTGNNSLIGMAGGAQAINLQDYYEFLVCHELGHALGLIHEQQRSDRDQYISINTANIQSGQQPDNFDIVPGSLNHGPYDFDSVMQYSLVAFSVNGQPTMTIKPPYNAQWNSSNVGQESHLSVLDKAGIVSIYGPPTVTASTTRYVSPAGSDSGMGTLGAPFLTIQAGLNASTIGDTLIIEDGTYTGPGNVDLSFSGRDMTVTSQHGPAKTIIDCGGSSGENHRGFIFRNGETSAVLSGLTIENGYESSDNGGGIEIFGSSVTLQNCILKNNFANYGGGIENDAAFGGKSGTVSLVNCILIWNTAANYGGGMENNDNSGTVTLTNCSATGNSAIYGGGIFNYAVQAGSLTLTNNIFYGDLGGEITNASNSVSKAVVSRCDVQSGYVGTGNLNADPLFVSTTIPNLRLQPGSPCIGAGTSVGASATDLDGVTRPNPPSLGAYEFQSGPTHILWNNSDGRLSLWNYNTSTGGFTQNTYGPYAGWTAAALADGPDGKARILWDNTDGRMSLWSLDNSTGTFMQNTFGPYTGWTAKAVSVGKDNTTHILWDNTDGSASLWNYNTSSGTFTQNTYGPYTGWTAGAMADGPDHKTRVLWNNTDGTMSLWSIDNNIGAFAQFSFGPYTNWSAKAVSVGKDNTTHILWDNTDGRISLWDYSTTSGTFTQNTYGAFAGWTAVSLGDGTDGRTRVLWSNTDGRISLWSLNNPLGSFSQFTFGSYSGWSATAVSAGP